ncbi:MAG: folate-binding protein [Rubrivivax sp.]
MSASPAPAGPFDGALRLSDWGLIRAQGADARSFLHAQLTQDVQHLPVGRATPAGYCSAKGRLLASFVLWPVSDDEVWLACSADLLADTVKRLSMFVLRAKCRLSDLSTEVELWGSVGPAAAGAPAEPWQVQRDGDLHAVRLPDAWVDGQRVARALHVLPAGRPLRAAALEPALWQALEARAGVPRIVAATRELFVPQMVNLELVGGVSFQKGCYPGQEVVARSQYRGTLKRRGFALHGTAPMAPAQEVFHSADPGQPAGQVVLAGQLAPGRVHALVELKIAATEGGTLHLGAPDGPPLQLDDLPYALPTEAA